jgi:hypothetical protein
MLIKNSNNTIGNRSRDLRVGSAVPQPTAPPRAPNFKQVVDFLFLKGLYCSDSLYNKQGWYNCSLTPIEQK